MPDGVTGQLIAWVLGASGTTAIMAVTWGLIMRRRRLRALCVAFRTAAWGLRAGRAGASYSAPYAMPNGELPILLLGIGMTGRHKLALEAGIAVLGSLVEHGDRPDRARALRQRDYDALTEAYGVAHAHLLSTVGKGAIRFELVLRIVRVRTVQLFTRLVAGLPFYAAGD